MSAFLTSMAPRVLGVVIMWAGTVAAVVLAS